MTGGAPGLLVDRLTLQEAIDLVRRELVLLPLAALGPVLEVDFPEANTARDLAHGLQATPDGYVVVLQSGGVVQATRVHLWTSTIAWLQASADHTRARVQFYTLREGVIQHVVP